MNKLQEQIKLRDDMIFNARRRYQIEGIETNGDLEDPRIMNLDELISNTSLFPPIENRTLGKATGALIKSLLNSIPEKDGSNSKNQGSNQRRQ